MKRKHVRNRRSLYGKGPFFKIIRTAFFTFTFVILTAVLAFAADVTWKGATGNGGTGLWSLNTNWSGNTLPGILDNVLIDNGKPANSVVNLDTTASINNLTIDSGDTLNFQNGAALTVTGGSVNNAGALKLSSTGSNVWLYLANGTQLTGGGTITLSDSTQNWITGTAATAVVTNVNNTIQGAGGIGFGGASFEFINMSGNVINANGTQQLIIRPTTDTATVAAHGGGFVNQGILEATGAGGLVLFGGQFNNNGGMIKADGGNIYLQNTVTISGGTLASYGSNSIQLATAQTAILDGTGLGGITLAGTYQAANNTSTYLSGTFINNGQVQLNSTGSNVWLYLADGTHLTGGGTITLSDSTTNFLRTAGSGTEVVTNVNNTISGAGQIGWGSSFVLVNGGTIDATGSNALILAPTTNGTVTAGLVNQAGGVLRGSGAGGLQITQGKITNNGTMEVLNGSQLIVTTGATLTNFSGSTLTGGTYNVLAGAGTATMKLPTSDILTNAATVLLDGANSQLLRADNSTDALKNLTNNAVTGRFTIQNGRNFNTAGNFTNAGIVTVGDGSTFTTNGQFMNNPAGQLQMRGGTFNATSNLVNSTNPLSELNGYGTVNSTNVILNSNGTVRSSGGTLTLNRAVTGTADSIVQIDAGSTLVLGDSAANGTSIAGYLIHNGNTAGSLNLVAKNITVSTDYQNANFGIGNSFNARANVSGAGLINGNNASQTITGATAAGANTWTLNLGNLRGGTSQTLNYQIANNGTIGGASIRGAVQTAANGGNITDSRLSGSGVTAANFGPIANAGNSGNLGVTFNATSGGSLTGQSIAVVSNFSNVTTQIINLSGQASALAQGNATPNSNPVVLDNFHVNGAQPSQAFAVQNTTPASSYAERLGIGSVGTTGNFSAGNNFGPGFINGGASQANAVSAQVNNGLAGVNSGSVTIQYTTNGVLIDPSFTTINANSQTINLRATGYNLAQSNVIAPVNIVAHVGDGGGSISQALTIGNIAPTGLYSEGLNSSFGSYTAGGGDTLTPTFSGSITNLAAGSTDNTSMKATISTTTAGLFNGSVVVQQASNGANTSGLGITPLANQNVGISGSVTGGVFTYAQPTINTTLPINFGNVRIGTSVANQSLSISNTAPVSAFTEALNGSVVSAPSGFSATGSFSGLQATSPPTANTSISVGMNTVTAGHQAGNVVLGFVSDGTGIAGDGTTTPLSNQNVAVTGNVYRLANPTVNTTTPINLYARVGDASPTASVSITNTSPDIYTEGLNASIGTSSSPFTAGGSISNLAAQQTNSSTLQIGLGTGTAGSFTGNAALTLTSTGAGTTGASDYSLTGQNVALTGKVYTPAVASLGGTVNFGTVHVGASPATQQLTVQNAAVSTALNDVLGGTLAVSGPFTGGGSIGTLLSPGGTQAFNIGLNTSTAGSYSSNATFSGVSHNGDMSDLNLTPVTAAISAKVNNYAVAEFVFGSGAGTFTQNGSTYTLNFGTVFQNSATLNTTLFAENGANGPADWLSGSFSLPSSLNFGETGFSSFLELAAGNQTGPLQMAFNTANLGTFTDIITLSSIGGNESGYSGALGNITLDITGVIVPSTSVPEPATLVLLGFGLIGLFGLRRKLKK